jgi:hypothetical protein
MRVSRCNSKKRKPAAVSIPTEVARYRLALLDAAEVAEAIVTDMAA